MPDGAGTPDLGYAMSLPPEKAIAYFRQKGYAISWDWHDTQDEAHARAFTVARVTRLDVLKDIRSALDQNLAQGQTEKWFVDQLTPVLQERGWWGKQEIEIQPGRTHEVQLGSPERLRLIYRQNTQSAMMAGRYADFIKGAQARPYWMYVAVMDLKTRPSHAAMHGRVFRWDDPIWATHWPPCGWNCRCRVRALSQAALDRMGLQVESSQGRLVNKWVTAGVDFSTGEIRKSEVTGIKLTARDGKPITFFPDAGFNFNQAQAAWQPDLDTYPSDIARQYVQGLVTGPEFERWFSIWSRSVQSEASANPDLSARQVAENLSRGGRQGRLGMEYPVAVLMPSDREALKTDSQTVLLSTQSLIEHLAAHPEVGIDAYQDLQKMVDEGEVYQQGDQRIVLLHVGDKLYRAAIKVDAQRQRLYLLTLFQTSEDVANAQVRNRLTRVR
jgi:SPP1 gp7 family putative phage head morphogenesis protein